MTDAHDAMTAAPPGQPEAEAETFISRIAVTPDLIIAYAQAVGETNPRYLDPNVPGGMVAPPTFFYANRFDGGGGVADGRPRRGQTSLLAADHAEFLAEVRPGDTITAWGRHVETYTKTGRSGTLQFSVSEIRFVNQHGQTVTRLRRSSAISSTIQPPAPAAP